MFVDAQVSSMNARRSGSRSSRPSIHSSRRFRTSGRSCSVACAVFFARDPVPVEEPPQRADPDRRAALGEQRLQLDQRNVILRLDRAQGEGCVACTAVAALQTGGRRAVLNDQLTPADRARRAHPEPRGCGPARHPAINRGIYAGLLDPAQSLNQKTPPV